MKLRKTLAIIFCAALVLALSAPALATTVNLPVSPNFTPVIDGQRDDGYSESFVIDNFSPGAARQDGANATVWTAWDADYLFFYMEIPDVTPNHEHANPWERDNVEWFIDWNSVGGAHYNDAIAAGGSYWQIRIASAPTAAGADAITGDTRDATSLDDIRFYVRPLVGNDLSQGYVIEAAFPRANTIGPTVLAEGLTIYMDFQIGDNIDGFQRDSQALIGDYAAQWNTPNSVGGIMTLGGAPAAAAPEAPAAPADDGADEPAPVADPGPQVVATPAPTTFDPIAIIALGAVAAAGAGALIIKKRK